MWQDFRFKKKGLIFLSLLFSLLISWIIMSFLFLNSTPLFSFSKVQKSIASFGFKLNKTVDTFLAGITAEKIVTDKAKTGFSSTVGFVFVSPTINIVLPTLAQQPSIKLSKAPVNKAQPSSTGIPYRPSPTSISLLTKIPTHVPSPTSLLPLPTKIPTPKVINYSDPLGLPPPSLKIHDLAVEIGEKEGVPPALILTHMYIETGRKFYNKDNAYIEQYSKPGTSLPYSYADCSLTQCGEAGPMQMTIGYDSFGDTKCSRCTYSTAHGSCPANAWEGVSEQVKSLIGSSSVSPCNIRENMYGAAIKIKYDSTYVVAITKYGGVIDTDCAWSIKDKPVTNGMKWNMKAVYLAGCHYHGSCTIKYPNLNNKNYCEYLWDSLPSEHKIN